MNICIFPGTFNPIHEAHLNMANFVLNKYEFDKVIFIPAYIPPHKQINKNLAEHRFKMVQIATSANSRFKVSDVEFKSEGKSYTLLTVLKIKELYGIEGKVNLLIGTDAFAKIKTWYKTDELAKFVHFIVCNRGVEINEDDFLEYDYEITNLEFLDISSTDLRNKCESGKIDDNVREYINKNGLYKY